MKTQTRVQLPEIHKEYQLHTLPDGRTLCYSQYGDPKGFPAFYFHGTPSSRHEAVFADSAGKKHGIRLIALDRPGFGHSTFQPKRTFLDWPEDVLMLADTLGHQQFGVVGHSGAGPHLFACGATISPDRLRFVGALGPWGPVASSEIKSTLNRLDRFYLRLARKFPVLMRVLFAPIGWCVRFAPQLFFRIMQSSVSTSDRSLLKDAVFVKKFTSILQEAFRKSTKGGAYEALICYSDWKFSIRDIRVPTHIWLGEEDIFVPRKMGVYLERTIPDVDFHFVPNKGHFNIENWDDILAACVRHVR